MPLAEISMFLCILFAVFMSGTNGQCDQDILEIPLKQGQSANITTPSYPAPYAANLNCTWYFTYPGEELGVTVRFYDFETELNYDKLQLSPYAEANLSSSLVFQGKDIVRVVFMPWNELWVQFNSDGGGAEFNGFNMDITVASDPVCLDNEFNCTYQISYIACIGSTSRCDTIPVCDDGSDESNCGFCFDQEEASLISGQILTITSPGYPLEYPSNMNCSFHVTAPTGYRIVLTIVDFQIEFVFDRFYINSTNETSHEDSLVLSGVQVPDVIYTDSNDVWLGFQNDATGVGFETGFEIDLSLDQNEQPGCDENRWPCINIYLECFQRKYLCDNGNLPNCPDGSDQTNCDGVLSSKPQVVSLTDGNMAIVSSPAFPLFYPANIDIEWQVLSPPRSFIRLLFVNISLAIEHDFLYIHHNKSSDLSSSVKSLTGSKALGMEFISGPELWLRFIASDVPVHGGMGFSIQLSTEGLCLNQSTTSSTLVSNVQCFTHIVTPPTHGIKVVASDLPTYKSHRQLLLSTNISMETGETVYFTKDVLSVISHLSDVWLGYLTYDQDGNAPRFLVEITRFTNASEEGTCSTNDFECNDEGALITCFDSSVECDFQHQCADGSDEGPQCDICSQDSVTLHAPSARGLGWLSPPGYPIRPYNSDQKCRWLIKASETKRIAIGIEDVVLERGYDFLTINETARVIVVLTGGSKLTQITSNDAQVAIAFTTDNTVSDKGFNIEVWQFESTAPSCTANDFQCINGFCVDQSALCDGMDDCLDMTDELKCEEVLCTDTFPCSDNKSCILCDEVCDGVLTCAAGEDEKMCDVIKCPDECVCVYQTGGQLRITCLHASITDVSKIPKITDELDILAGDEFLKPGRFKSLQSLTMLTIIVDGENITQIPELTFDRLGQLTVLNITNLGFLGNETFEELSTLNALIVWNGGNIDIAQGAFIGLDSLNTLIIVKGNPLIDITSSLSSSHLKALPNLQNIFVDDFRFCCEVQEEVPCTSLKSTYSISECDSLLGDTVFRILTLLLGICAIIGNSTVVILFIRNRKEQSGRIQYIVLANLAISDMLMGVYLIIIAGQDMNYDQLYQTLSRTWQSSTTCRAASFLAFLSSQASLIFLLILCIYHFIALLKPLEGSTFSMKSTTVCMALVWIFSIVLSTVFAALVGPSDNDQFGLSDVCFSLPYLIKPNAYTVEIGDPANTVIDIPTSTPKSFAWYFLSTILFGLDLICVLFIICIMFRISLYGIRNFRNNTNQIKDQIKLAVKMAPFFILKIVCWLVTIAVGLWSLTTGNVVPEYVYPWLIVFVFPLGSCLGSVLYLSVIQIYIIVLRSTVKYEPIDDNFNHNQSLATDSQRQYIDNTIELKTHEDVTGCAHTDFTDPHAPLERELTGRKSDLPRGVQSDPGDICTNLLEYHTYPATDLKVEDTDIFHDVRKEIPVEGLEEEDTPTPILLTDLNESEA